MPKKKVKLKKKKLKAKKGKPQAAPSPESDAAGPTEHVKAGKSMLDSEGTEETAAGEEGREASGKIDGEAQEEKAKEPEKDIVRLKYRALSKVLRHGLRFSHPKMGRDSWVECMGFLIGDVNNGLVEVKDAVPMVHGSLVEVEFNSEHYAKADEINQNLTDENWIVGWYHTHPGHGLFLSSVDKINHSGYQSLNPKAVALVFDPSKFDGESELEHYIKLFRLKNPQLREGSEFIEVDEVDVDSSFPEVTEALYEASKTDAKMGPLVLEYGEDYKEPAFEKSEEAENMEKDMAEMRIKIENMEREIIFLRAQLEGIIESGKEPKVAQKKRKKTKPRKELAECPFCGYDSVLPDDTQCASCGKQF
jgi:proteasome lid subunit RPN8/RPN11